MTHSESRPGHLYLIRAGSGGVYKVGFAIDPLSRMELLQVGCPLELTLHATFTGGQRLEWLLHKQLAPQRIRGEWFAFHCDPVETVEWFVRAKGLDYRQVPVSSIPTSVRPRLERHGPVGTDEPKRE